MEISPRRAEARRNFVLAFSPMLRAVPVRCDVTSQPRWSVMPAGLSDSPLQQRRRRPSGGGRRLLVSIVWLSLLMGRVVQNGPEPSRARR